MSRHIQQRLDFLPPEQPHYGNWVRHLSAEAACNRMAMWLVHGGSLWLTSEQVSGKSHFLQAISLEHPFLGVVRPDSGLSALKQVDRWCDQLERFASWAVDMPAGSENVASGFALFHLIERAKQKNRPLLICWRCTNEDLQPPELASRMRVLEQVNMPVPEDDLTLGRILRSTALTWHWEIPDGVLEVMLTYLPRDLATLLDALRQLEAASFEEQKRITKSWVKKHLDLG
ncbi:MAG: glucose-inhibited division protein A [Zetaproteobacteria bacterium CG02_land_8_20_14_3_00_50_9]|nr:MAG: glucose-inhibited division protein A [Zetaproteobacteria bacterium CG17_big_fil_post_rev_8_21_14_2_50_50_13]PIV30478.1 MAG: glucose-inhibited division protein A [Zetaproteobacteria bacterium CG02_land_8_20_14_3_00_50_9]PIY54900.1 MAG: glucose-inhibited division protein A [Zetaproteobacteria bacterium CG_4_10_14_0_8_um_filter_49_80]